MPSFSHSFFAMGSDCTAHLSAESLEEFETLALAAEGEVVRIERRYSRYKTDSELSRINAVAARGGSIDVDEETAALIEYAKACYTKSDGAFDITSAGARWIERRKDRIRTLLLEDGRRILGLEGLLELRLSDRTGSRRVNRIEQVGHLLLRRGRHNLRRRPH